MYVAILQIASFIFVGLSIKRIHEIYKIKKNLLNEEDKEGKDKEIAAIAWKEFMIFLQFFGVTGIIREIGGNPPFN